MQALAAKFADARDTKGSTKVNCCRSGGAMKCRSRKTGAVLFTLLSFVILVEITLHD